MNDRMVEDFAGGLKKWARRRETCVEVKHSHFEQWMPLDEQLESTPGELRGWTEANCAGTI